MKQDTAFAELNKAYEDHEPGAAFFKSDPRFDCLRDDARFQELLKKVGFPR